MTDGGMTWWGAVLWALGIIAFWVALMFGGDALNHLYQRRMAATLWKSLSEDKRKEPS